MTERRTFTIEYASGVDVAERMMAEQKGITVSGWVHGASATANRDDFATNRVTVGHFRDTLSAAEGNAEGLSAAGACVSFWAGNIAGLPLHVLQARGGVDVPFPEHPLYWLLHDSPNYDQSSFDFWEQMTESLEWRGNAYAQMGRTDAGFLTSLTPVSPCGMRVSRGSDGDLVYEWNDGGRQTARSRDMLHIRGRGGNALGGASTLATYRRALSLALVTEGSADAIFRNSARPSGTLTTDTKMNFEQLGEFEERLATKWQGANNAGRPMVLHSGLKWDKVTIDPVDAEMLESRRLSMEIVCQIFECDPHLVGITSGNTQLGSSISDQTLSLVKFKMHKRLKRIEKALEKQLLTRADRQRGVKIRFNLEGFLRADSLGRAQYYNLMKQFMTTNEIRALEGLPPVPGGDEIYRQVQDQPLGARGIGDNGGPPLEENA
ncbi:phage portal protein [Sphingomonas sp. ID0503]|uniref:phage portal protein n=1 Tax=Sphingomonas sp. ID0503 TaxID=3399691 RepID=UPI003AFACA87